MKRERANTHWVLSNTRKYNSGRPTCIQISYNIDKKTRYSEN